MNQSDTECVHRYRWSLDNTIWTTWADVYPHSYQGDGLPPLFRASCEPDEKVVRVPGQSERSDEQGRDACPSEELRLALVMNGGVSLAVWMGGAGLEIDRLTRSAGDDGKEASKRNGSSGYRALLDLVRSTARVDVIAGTSAGGINGAALALSQCNVNADFAGLRNLWAEQGGMEALLRQPFQGQPASLLRGDEYFLPQLNAAMKQLARDAKLWPKDKKRNDKKQTDKPAPIDLTLTTTLLVGTTKVTVDALGQRIPDVQHSGTFRFREDDFEPGRLTDTARALALAARSSASYPVAFEPSFVPVTGSQTTGPLRPDLELRPDMTDYVSWSRDAAADRSRFVVDGGVLANTPTRAALDAINRMQVDQPARRVMVLVHPHAPSATRDLADDQAAPPNAVRTMGSLLGALTAQGSRNFVSEITDHNRVAAGWRGGRTEILRELGCIEDLDRLVAQVWPHFRRLQLRLAACGLANRLPEDELEKGWSVDRVSDAALAAMDQWRAEPGNRQSLPFLPAERPGVGNGLVGHRAGEQGWAWGRTAARGVVDAASDVLRRATSVARKGEVDRLAGARETLCTARATIRRKTAEVESRLIMAVAEPDQAHWERCIKGYAAAMSGEIGSDIGEAVRAVCAAVLDVQDVVLEIEGDPQRGSIAELGGWHKVLEMSGVAEADRVRTLVARLLSLDVATSMVADQRPTSYGLPIDLVQLTLQAANPFAEVSTTPEDKAAGLDLNRFGGFLKRSWRLNDWIWGRLDAASVLCSTVLSPDRVRRVALLRGEVGDEGADAMLERLSNGLFPEGLPAHLKELHQQAREQLRDLLRTKQPAGADPAAVRAELPRALPGLADLCVWALHGEIILDELPFLVGAIRADAVEGAPRGSNGEIFLAQNKDLIDSVTRRDHLPEAEPQPPRSELALRALKAFDRAGIGRESLRDQAAGDQLIRTAATATAVAATVLDSDRSGLGLLRPVTRLLRGIALLPFWVIAGLTRGGKSARYLALFGLAVGGLFLVLSLTGGLPAWVSGPAALGGGGALLAALGYSALRSGTILHGVVLLGPVAALTELAVERVMAGPSNTAGSSAAAAATTQPAATFGFATLLLGVAVIFGLIFLGSLPSAEKSPLGLLRSLVAVVRAALPRTQPSSYDPQATRNQARRRLVRWCAQLSVSVAVLLLGIAFIGNPEVIGELTPVSPAAALGISAALVVGCGAWVTITGRGFQRWTRTTPDKPWQRQTVLHPAVVAASWSYVYGVGYLLVAGAILGVFHADRGWLWATAVACAVLGVLLASAVPVVILGRARARLVRDLAVEIVASPACGLPEMLERRGGTYAFLVRPAARRASGLLDLTARGEDLRRAAIADRGSPHRSGIPVSIHLIGAAMSVLVLLIVLAVSAIPAVLREWWWAGAGVAFGVAVFEGLYLVRRRDRKFGLPGARIAACVGTMTVFATLASAGGEHEFAVAAARGTAAAVLTTIGVLTIVALVRGLGTRLRASHTRSPSDGTVVESAEPEGVDRAPVRPAGGRNRAQPACGAVPVGAPGGNGAAESTRPGPTLDTVQ